ncbi:peroxisomal leader peptide-processing protease-like [Oculina patagonica]
MADDRCVLVKRCNSDLSCCGIVLDSVNGIVLTVASLFHDALPQIESQRDISADSPFLFHDDFAATSPNGEIAVEVIFRRNGEEQFRTLQGHVVLYWRDYGLQRIAERIFPQSEWKFESFGQGELAKTALPAESGNGDETLAHRNCLSDFVLIQVKTLSNYFSTNPFNLSTVLDSGRPKKGDTVFIVGTPFGCECPPVFYNSLSKAIVSNVVGMNDEIIITDARCVPGCEGCPLYLKRLQSGSIKNSAPYGIVLAPFCWRNGEWTGITVASSLGYVLRSLWKLVSENLTSIPQHLTEVLFGVLNCQDKSKNQVDRIVKANQDRNTSDMHSDQNILRARDITKTALSSVVMVHCGNTWGSGIVVDAEACLIATCSHVIRDCHNTLIVTEDKTISRYLNSAREVRISQDSSNSTHHKAQVLYATKEDCPLDFALLKVKPNPEFRSLRLRLGPAVTQIKPVVTSKPLFKKGEEICVVGFPLFASHLHTGASIVSGIISNVAYADNKPVLLQSTAAVHCGASGGALVSMETGELLGMVTSHTKDANLSSSFPHINFSIPADLLYKLVSAVKSEDIEDTLQGLVSDHMKNVWQLKETVKEKPHITSRL